jgi:hypothetical protein
MRRHLDLVLLAVAFAAATPAAKAAAIGGGDVHVGPPLAQHNLGDYGTPTASWLERTVTFPGSGYVTLNAYADTQSSDRLELIIDGATAGSMSGSQRCGRLAAPVGAGSHTIRIQYSKDETVDEGLDTVWADNVRMIGNNQVLEEHSFSNASGCSIPGWTSSGFGGGWCASYGPEHREMRRPASMAYAGYQPAPVAAGITRSIAWPDSGTTNELSVAYMVDSEQDHDFFRILVDGIVKFQDSGHARTGTAKVAIAGGTHQIQLDYLKDESGDEGWDEARVISVEARANGVTYQLPGADGDKLGSGVSGWTQTASNPLLNWDVVRPRPSLVVTTPDEVPRTIDGMLRRAEYSKSARVKWFYHVDPNDIETRVRVTTNNAGSVILGFEIAEALAESFALGGKVTLLVDSAVLADPRGANCGATDRLPGPASRKIEVSWDAAGLATITQQLGQCDSTTPWSPAAESQKWPFSVGMVKHATEGPPAYTIEMQLDPVRPSGFAANSPVALMLRVETTSLGPFATLPRRAHPAPTEIDPTTWEEIWLGETEIEPTPLVVSVVDAVPRQ